MAEVVVSVVSSIGGGGMMPSIVPAATQGVRSWTQTKKKTQHNTRQLKIKDNDRVLVRVSGDEKETWCLSLPYLTPHTIVFLCVSSIHNTLEPSLSSIPSLPIPLPPSHTFNTNKVRMPQHNHQKRGAVFFSFSIVHPLKIFIKNKCISI
jgi:hypothetical protein